MLHPLHRYGIPTKETTTVNQQIKAYLISLLRLFGVGVLGQYILINKSVFELDFADGKVIIAAGIAAVIFSVANALNPADKRYGIGAPATKELSAGDVATNTDDDGDGL
jgi:hypothetical protein